MAVDYLQEYLGIDPNDYSAMEQRIAGVSPVGQSIIPRLGEARTPIKPPTFVGGPPNLLPIRPIRRPTIPKEPTPDFGSQISGLEEEIAKLTEQMSLLETEKQKALEDQDIMRAELAQAQQDALAQQGEQFATERSALEQQIADLTAQVGQQPPADMSTATGEGGLPEGYSYTPGPGSEGMAYTMVMPEPGFRYAYGPDGDRIQVPDNRPPIDQRRPMPPPPLPPREELIPPNKLPPKRDDQLFIDDRPIIDERMIDRGYGPGIMPPLPPRDIEKLIPPKRDDQLFIDDRPPDPRLEGVIKPPQRPIGIPPLRKEDVGGGGYKEFETPDGRVLGVGVRPPSFSTNPDRKGRFGSLVDKIRNSIQPVPVPPGQEGQLPIAPVNTGPIKIFGQTLSQEDSDRLRAGSEGGLKGIVNRSSERLKNNPNTIRRGGFFNKIKTPQPPQPPTMTPRRQPMSVGGVGGISGRRSMRPMMRAGGGAIGQAIADLQNRLR